MNEIFLLKSRLDKQGGAEKYTWRLGRAFVDKGWNVTLLTSGISSPPPKIANLTIRSLPAKQWLSVSKVRAFDRFCQNTLSLIRTKSPIFSLDRNSYQTHLRASNGVHAAYLDHRKGVDSSFRSLSFRLNPLHRHILSLEKSAFTHPGLQALIVNSHLVKNEVLFHYSVDPKKIHVIHNGVEWEEKENPFNAWEKEKERQCRTLSLHPDDFHFLFVGHNFHRKGLTPLLKGFSRIKDPSVHLSIVGSDQDEIAFQSYARQLKIEDRVHFWGARQDPTPFYQFADALVIPSYYDPFANVTVEALAMGLFVVTSKTNGGHEILTEQSGCTIDSLEEPESIATALTHALKHKKTPERATQIRNSVKHLDFSSQLSRITDLVLP